MSKIIDLKSKKLSYEENGFKYELLFLNKEKMTLEVNCFKKNELIKKQIIAFAHIPKKLKAKLNPK